MIGLIGKKLGQTRVYDAQGNAVCVTVVHAGPNRVVQIKNDEGSDGYNAVQLGYDDQAKPERQTKPLQGHFGKHGSQATKLIKEFRNFSVEVNKGDTVPVTVFEAGDYVDVIADTKGRGFQGVVKRWNFGGGPRATVTVALVDVPVVLVPALLLVMWCLARRCQVTWGRNAVQFRI